MRVRVTGGLSGSIDGIQLSQFEPGRIYDVHSALGCYLMAMGRAMPVSDATPALIVPLESQGVDQLRENRSSKAPPFERAAPADRPRRRVK